MSQVRYKALRRRLNRATTTDEEKLRALRALFMMVYNSEASLIPLTTELFHVLGDILEGTPPEELRLYRLNKETFLQTYEDLS